MKIVLEETFETFREAWDRREELASTKEYSMVKTSRLKVGLRPCKWNNFKQSYQYSVRAYDKTEEVYNDEEDRSFFF